ncbi:hypothetical protein [Actinoplanes palleronii]|uniref:hypothetical protein n=1 Tax=Actinoplanes palleronii TaxID=113570 RepID=UPI001EF29128|nr:hypothetical protein [Actinoplanes palleronii]
MMNSRSAVHGVSSAGRAASAATSRAPVSPVRPNRAASLVGKYRKNVLREMSAAAQMSSTVVAS